VLDIHLPTTPAEAPVDVRQREIVGAFDTVTLAAHDPHALVEWLRGHGYAVPAGIEPVAAQYVSEGWVFNAMRLRRAGDRAEAVRIQPLSFTFDAAAPVYPMRLTGVVEKPVRVEMYVAAQSRAEADGFEVARCARVDDDWRHESDRGNVVFGDTAATRLLPGGSVLTRLERTFEPEAMKADVPIRFREYETLQPTVFSERAARAMALNVGAMLAIGALVGLASAGATARPGARRPRRWLTTAVVLFLAADATLAILALTPTVPTRVIDPHDTRR
jgi:hypothetical protein